MALATDKQQMLEKIFNIYEKKLEKELSLVSISELLEKMDDNSYYFPYNIWKKYFDRNVFELGKQISWFAYRQAEKTSNINQFEVLKEVIEKSSSNIKKVDKAYFVVGQVCRNTKSKKIFEYLMDKISVENEEHKLTILISIEDCHKPIDYNLEPIFELLRNGKMEMKTNAALALNHSMNPLTEEILIDSFVTEKNKHLQEMIASTLGDIGTEKSLPILKDKLKTAKGVDFKYFLNQAIEDIEKRRIIN